MTLTRRIVLGAALMLAAGEPARAQKSAPAALKPGPAVDSPATPAAAPPVQARASLDRTAMWVGDHVTYTVEIACAPGLDVLLDDLAKDRLHVDGFEVVGSDSAQSTEPDGSTIHDIHYELTTFLVNRPSLSVLPFSVRYYLSRPGQRPQDAAPAGEVQVPGAMVALRSTLPDGQTDYQMRDARQMGSRSRILTEARPVGLALVVVCLVPVVGLAVAFGRRRVTRPARASARRVRSDRRALLEELRALDVDSETARRAAYDRVSAAVRQHVESVAGIGASSLTAAEIDAALSTDGRRVDRALVSEVLASCDAARYAPADQPTDPQACRDAIARAETILSAR